MITTRFIDVLDSKRLNGFRSIKNTYGLFQPQNYSPKGAISRVGIIKNVLDNFVTAEKAMLNIEIDDHLENRMKTNSNFVSYHEHHFRSVFSNLVTEVQKMIQITLS